MEDFQEIRFSIFGIETPTLKGDEYCPSLNRKDLKQKTQYLDDVVMSLEAIC